MMVIITKNKIYKWYYKRLLKHLFMVVTILYFIGAYLYASNMDYLTMMGL